MFFVATRRAIQRVIRPHGVTSRDCHRFGEPTLTDLADLAQAVHVTYSAAKGRRLISAERGVAAVVL